MRRILVSLLVISFLTPSLLAAKTLMLEGKLDSSITMRQQMEFNVDKGQVQTFTFRFALPASFKSKSVSQSVNDLDIAITPRPDTSSIEQDRFGNRFQKVAWSNINSDVRINLSYLADIHSELSAMESRTPFPVGQITGSDAIYLKSTELVQSDSPAISALARRITASARNEYEAVAAITNYVADNVKYTFNPPQYDASYTLETKSGNCQNFAHLCVALLRSVGIPARIVGGITLKDSWKVPIDSRSSIVQSMGQGGHAWMEVYFPDLGWLPYDPQQSRQFTSSRHIKQTHGLDSRDINDTWRGAPYLPRYSEMIDGSFRSDDIKLVVKGTGKDPRPYIISNLMAVKNEVVQPDPVIEQREKERSAREKMEQERLKRERLEAEQFARLKADEEHRANEQAEKDRLAKERSEADRIALLKADAERKAKDKAESERIARQKAEADRIARIKADEERIARVKAKQDADSVRIASLIPKKKKPVRGAPLVFGNMEFPNLVTMFNVNVEGDIGTRVLEKETSEYVTSQYIYAQAFTVQYAAALEKISLAMRKFGGDGNVYIDLVRDREGKPNIIDGIRSNLVSLDSISRKPGYYWVDFTFPTDVSRKLQPGKYWIVFRSSGEAIMNWFFVPGKPFSESDDTRSTAKGFQWDDILNYDFVFKVTTKVL